MKKRYSPARNLPPYVFVPGETPHPKKAGGHMEGEGDPIATPLDSDTFRNNEALRYALDLYNHGFFWESHVFFEALWNAHKREGSTADFLKALIKLAAGGVKISIGQRGNATDHLLRAQELLRNVMSAEGPEFFGFNLPLLITRIDETLADELDLFEIHPDWE